MVIDTDMIIADKEKCWFIDSNTYYLFCLNCEKKEINYVETISSEMRFRKYNSGVVKNNKIYFFPFNADNILIYDIEEKKFIERKDVNFSRGSAQYSISVAYKNDLIAISTYGDNSIIRYSIDEDIVYKYEIEALMEGSISRDYLVCEDKLYLVKTDRPDIIEIDLNTFESRIHHIESVKEGFGTICLIDKQIVLTGLEGIYIIELPSYKVEKKCEYPFDFEKSDNKMQPFGLSLVYKHKVYMISSLAPCSLVYDMITDEILKIDLEDEENEDTLKKYPVYNRFSSIKHIACLMTKNEIFYTVSRSHKIKCLDVEDNNQYDINYNISANDKMKMTRYRGDVMEGEILDIQEWISEI